MSLATGDLTAEELLSMDLFEGVDERDAHFWIEKAKPLVVPGAGVEVAAQGAPPEGVLLLIDGTVSVRSNENGTSELVNHNHGPTWIGAIPVLVGDPLPFQIVSETPCRIFRVDAEDFNGLIFSFPEINKRVMQQVGPVFARISSISANRERLASLGTMSAGLAHELNNPAAAAHRASNQLEEALVDISSALSVFVEKGVEREDAEKIVTLQKQATSGVGALDDLDSLAAADLEDSIQDHLEDLGVSEPWRYAEPLAAAGVDDDWLDRMAEAAGPARDAAFGLVSSTISARCLTQELEDATSQMTDLLSAMKKYSYMDKGGLVEADLHEDLIATLKILHHKFKQYPDVHIKKEFDKSIPKLNVRGSELNQVWTNLISNALDAIDGDGTITITTRQDDTCVEVDIADDGPGIPEEDQSRIFDSFFTTKDVGKGTGLGLSTARQIVNERMGGSLTLLPTQNGTAFRVRFPFKQT